MNFGPYTPQEIENIVTYLTTQNIEFNIIFDKDTSKEEIQSSPENDLSLSTFRTRAYLGQHFYIEIPEEKLTPDIKKHIISRLTNQDVILSDGEYELGGSGSHTEVNQKKIEMNKWIQKVFALLFLAYILWSMFKSI